MTDSLAHRGPDGEGFWVDPQRRCVLGHRRLSVIDLSPSAAQPMSSGDGRWVVVHNGEIYNFQDIARQLRLRGVEVRGRSDTEVLANALSVWRHGALHRFDGMFAFAAFDTVTGELLLARDAFGEKPLYYMEEPCGGLAFASELQAIELLPGFQGAVSADAIAELLMFQYIGAPRTIYRGVKKLPPGHFLRIRPGEAPVIRRFFSFDAEEPEFERRTNADLADELEAILITSLRRRLIADVPVGAFLSGGVDSSTTCALVTKKLGVSLQTFSVGFAGTRESEHHAAREYASHLGLEQHVLELTPDSIGLLEDFGAILDEPNADWSCLPVYYLSKFAKGRVTVALSGDGGDEMCAGYDWYFPALEHEQSGEPWEADDAYVNGLLMTGPDVLTRLFGCLPGAMRRRMTAMKQQLNQPRPGLTMRLRQNEALNYLPGAVLAKVDRMAMRHALEVRTPYLSIDVARFAARLPGHALYGQGRGKLVLREIACRYLPERLVNAPKMGFGLPGGLWADAAIRAVADSLLGPDCRLADCLGYPVLSKYLQQERDVHRVWTLAMLESWCRAHPARLSPMHRPQ